MHDISNHLPAEAPEETFTCPFCGGRARIAEFCLDGDTLYQALCDSCGAPSYFSETREGAKSAWMV